MTHTHFKFYNKQDILRLTHVRKFETKLGERINCITENISLEETLQQTKCTYILFGIQIGRAHV